MRRRDAFDEKIQYWFETLIGKGTFTMIFLLFLVTILFTGIVGVVAASVCGGNSLEIIWDSLMHTLDSGVLAGDSLDDKVKIAFMTIMTVFGLCFTSVLIGIVNSCFEKKLYEMRLGTTKVMEKNHIVVLGYNYTIYKIIESLVEANANHKGRCVVVVGNEKTEVMLDSIKSHVGNLKTTKLICRSGKTYEEYMLERANVENAKTVIINARNDDHSIKTLLAFTSYIKDKKLYNPNLYVTVVIHDIKYKEAAEIAGGDRVKIIYDKDVVSRLIARASNQRGLCSVFEEVLDFYNYEIYCERIPEVYGKKFRDTLHMFEAQIPMGFVRSGVVHIKPDMDTVIIEGDELLLFEEDDGDYKISESKIEIDENAIKISDNKSYSYSELIILGQNERLNNILTEYNKNISVSKENVKPYVKIIDTENSIKYKMNEYANINWDYKQIDDFSFERLAKVIDLDKDFNVVILTNDDIDYEEADSSSILKLIELKKIAERTNNDFAITCEIRKNSNQRLAELIRVGNFVVGSNIGGLLSVQYAENPHMDKIFEELLNTEGAELYMKPVEHFVDTGVEMNFDTVIEAVSRDNSIVLGFRKIVETNHGDKEVRLITGPERDKKYTFNKGDTFIVLSDEP